MPDATAQFRQPEQPAVYMNGACATCGNHPSLPKRHKWSEWRQYEGKAGRIWRHRFCLTCGLSGDKYQAPHP